MRSILFFLSIFSLILCSNTANAQLQVGLNFDYANALGQFKQNIEHNPYGGGFKVFKNYKETDMIIGVDFNNYYYSKNSFDIDLTDRGFTNFTGERTQIDFYNTIHLFLRYPLSQNEQFKPYVEGRFGPTAFASFNMINEKDIDYRNYSLDFHDVGFSGGLGAGIVLKPKNFPIAFDLGIIGTTGSKAKYKGEVTDETNPRSGIYKTSASNITMRAGFIFKLNGCSKDCDCDDIDEIKKTIQSK